MLNEADRRRMARLADYRCCPLCTDDMVPAWWNGERAATPDRWDCPDCGLTLYAAEGNPSN